MKRITLYLVLLCSISIIIFSCKPDTQNIDQETGKDILKSHEISKNDTITYLVTDTVYVPIYSDIYSETKNKRFLLTATLSIRNTSLYDSMYVDQINYYDTKGNLVRNYIDNTIVLQPMESIEYVVEEKDESGGAGANFIIIWGARAQGIKPVFQGVMISTLGQQGISFTTEGISISRE